MTDIDPSAVMAEHSPYYWSGPDGSKTCEAGVCHDASWPCEPYRLAEALAASEAKAARVLDLGRYWNGPGHAPGRWDSSHAMDIRAAIEDTLDWSMWDEMAGRWAHERRLDQPEQAS